MIDLITLLSMLLLITPVILGAAIFGGIWLRDEFYREPFYNGEEDP